MKELQEMAFLACVVQLCFFTYKYLKTKKRRKWWVGPLYQQRKSSGFYEKTFKYIKENDDELFFKATRMSKIQYELLLSLVRNNLKKSSIRKPIDPECRLVLTLMYLSQGVSRHYLAWSFRIGVSTVRKIIIEVCEVLWDLLSPVYMPQMNISDWTKIALEFNQKWQMPNCVGCIDGKHVAIKCPPKSGSKFFNYKGHFSIVLLGVCDANYVFTSVDVGAFGSQSDGGIFRFSVFGNKILANEINIPPPISLPNSEKVVPHYFVGDSAFPLRKNLMRPYPGLLLNKEKTVFNYRLSRARRTIENTFGILTTRWRVLGSPIEFHPKNADKVVLACVILHNFLKITDDLYTYSVYCTSSYCDSYDDNDKVTEGAWRQENITLKAVRRFRSNNSTREAFEIRKILTDYFLSEGAVSFQPN